MYLSFIYSLQTGTTFWFLIYSENKNKMASEQHWTLRRTQGSPSTTAARPPAGLQLSPVHGCVAGATDHIRAEVTPEDREPGKGRQGPWREDGGCPG